MARDYRYGHKSAAPAPRRTQQGEAVQASEQRAADKPAKPFSSIIRKKPKQPVSSSATDGNKSAVAESTKAISEPKLSRDKAINTYRQSKLESSSAKTSVADDDVQKVKNKVYRDSLPKHIRKELEAQEALAKAQAEQAEIARLAEMAAQKEKRRQRLSLSSWLSIAGLTVVGIAWLLYAPFFLAFAFEMGWVSEETRNRMDPAASMRSELASNTFYGELPKDVVLAGAQPLAVKTKAPMYLQLLSLPNEAQAQAERRRLVQKGYVVQMATLAGKSGNNYVLRMGPYDDQRTLNRLKVELQKLGIDAREVSLASVVKASEAVKVTTNTTPNQPNSVPANNTRGAVAPR
ncbi:MAG: hypothetical protein B7Y29_08065 [Thiotrichales bacterium 16-46-22]|nr:MAG: hypothetical protein B7Y29_08065 [Thiotrichales bacterium 16-46-22]